jgi:predicted TIM-barrel fold metal-dependent hydrolase
MPGAERLRVVDAQVHAWWDGQSTGHHRRVPITCDVLKAEMVDAGVDRAVLVPPLWDPGGNAYALELARADPQRFAAMGVISPDDPDPERTLRGWRATPGLRGARVLFNTPARMAPLLDGTFAPFWPAAEELGVTTAVLAPGNLALIGDIAAGHPGLPIIVDHLGIPRGATGPEVFAHLPELLALARHPNIYVKAAAVGDYALDPYPFRSLDTIVRAILDAFGPRRVVWASDLSRLHYPYRSCVTHFTEATPRLSAQDLELIMGANICRLLDWP